MLLPIGVNPQLINPVGVNPELINPERAQKHKMHKYTFEEEDTASVMLWRTVQCHL